MNENETYRGITFEDSVNYKKKYLAMYRNQLLENVNYAQAVMDDSDLFGLSSIDLESHVQHYMDLYRITLFPFQLISLDDIKETIDKLANKERVKSIKEQAQYSSLSLYNILFVISQTVAGIFGLAVSSERIHITKAVLERGYYCKTEITNSTNGSYEKKRLIDTNIDGDLFVSGGAVSASKIEVDKSSCWFLNNSDEGYITFRTSTPNGLQRYNEVVLDCKFTGPCKLTFGGVFVVRDDNLLNGIYLQESKWKISSDGTCGIKLHIVETIGEKEIQCHYARLLESGVYDLKEYYVDFEAHVRALLHEVGCMVAW